ncbi:MAG: hypothetical protein NVS2B14_00410 [Chamaesiphon sp.]
MADLPPTIQDTTIDASKQLPENHIASVNANGRDQLRIFRKALIKTHNLKVARRYDHSLEHPDTDIADRVAKELSLIRSKDTFMLIVLRLLFYYLVLGNIKVYSIVPERWNPIPIFDRPLLYITYRPVSLRHSRIGSYQLVIPHFKGHSKPNLPTYTTGQHYGVINLKDNSQINVNCKTEKEAQRVLTALLEHVDHNYVHADPRYGRRAGRTLRNIELRPYAADLYLRGEVNPEPNFHWDYS